jgi:hypothetical protein
LIGLKESFSEVSTHEFQYTSVIGGVCGFGGGGGGGGGGGDGGAGSGGGGGGRSCDTDAQDKSWLTPNVAAASRNIIRRARSRLDGFILIYMFYARFSWKIREPLFRQHILK